MLQKLLKIIKNTHRHPVNQALHSVGAPFYALGIAMSVGHLAGMPTSIVAGSAMLFAAIAMFVLGHNIEGNLRSMAPVLLFQFVRASISGRSRRRKVARYPLAK
jgi:Na+/serine symporter